MGFLECVVVSGIVRWCRLSLSWSWRVCFCSVCLCLCYFVGFVYSVLFFCGVVFLVGFGECGCLFGFVGLVELGFGCCWYYCDLG